MKPLLEEHLIRGTFERERALEILSTLFTSKIQLHNVKTFNSFIRTGSESDEDNNRKTELKESLNRLKELIEKLTDDAHLVQLDCQVKLTVIDKKASSESIQGTESMRGHHA